MQSGFGYAERNAALRPLALADASLPTPKIQAPNLMHLSRGRSNSSQIDVTIDNPFHLQANPASKKNLIATELLIDAPPGIAVNAVTYPVGVPFRLSQVGAPISVYQGSFGIAFSLVASAQAHRGKSLVQAKLRYQACDEKTCFKPSQVPFDFWVEIQ